MEVILDKSVVSFELSNISGIGSEDDIHLRKEAANNEPAWNEAGVKEGLLIWRIEKFNVVLWPEDHYGQFFSGDTYIILKTFNNNGSLTWDLHMWIGEKSSQDEYGTAAIKIVELDEKLNREANLHREVQGNESKEFLKYFDHIRILEGGIESGFHKVVPESYKPKIIKIKGKKTFRCTEVPIKSNSLNIGDVFVIDNGLLIYVWRGSKSNSFEFFKAASVAEKIKEERKSLPKIINIEEGEETEEFWNIIGGKGEIDHIVSQDEIKKHSNQLFRLVENNRRIDVNEVSCDYENLKSDDVFILYSKNKIYIWIGKNASLNEKKNAFALEKKITEIYDKPKNLPISIINEGRESDSFKKIFSKKLK